MFVEPTSVYLLILSQFRKCGHGVSVSILLACYLLLACCWHAVGMPFIAFHLAEVRFDLEDAEAEKNAAVSERDAAIAERDAMKRDKKTAILAKDAAFSDRDAAYLERDAAIQQRDAAHAERDAAYHERDGARFDRDFAYMEKDAAVASLMAQVDSLKTERDALQKEMQAAIAKAQATAAQREALETEKKTLLAHNEALKVERDETVGKLLTLTAKKVQEKPKFRESKGDSDAGNRDKPAQAKEQSASIMEKMLLKAQKHTVIQNQNKRELIVNEESVKPLYIPPKTPKTARTNAPKAQRESTLGEPNKDHKNKEGGKETTAKESKTQNNNMDKKKHESNTHNDTNNSSSSHKDKRPISDKPKVLDLASLLVMMRPLKDTWKREGVNKPTMSMLKTPENSTSNKRLSLPALREDLRSPLSDSPAVYPHLEGSDEHVGMEQVKAGDDKKDMHNTKLKEWHDQMAQDTLVYTEHANENNDQKVDAKQSQSEDMEGNVPRIKDKVSVQKDQRYLNVAGNSKTGAHCLYLLYCAFVAQEST
jgi:hypothetical protein